MFSVPPKSLGEHIKQKRLALKLTQHELAARLGVSPWTILNWENGKTEPAPKLAITLLRFLGRS